MKLLVLDNYKSFSLVPYFKNKSNYEIYEMGNIQIERTWNIFKNVEPDIVFVDFCDLNAVILTNRINELEKIPKIIIRLHGYEAHSSFLNSIKWDKVSNLICVSKHYKKIVKKKLGEQVNIKVINNGIDLDEFKVGKNSIDNKSIAYVGYLNRKKGISLLGTVIASMPEFMFHIGGAFQEEPVELYLKNLKVENATFYGHIKTKEFLKGKRFILSTSVSESFGMSIAEGMAMGLTPMVHGWLGAEDLWPKECIWNTFDELRNIKPKNPVWCREWVEKRYSMDKCINGFIELVK